MFGSIRPIPKLRHVLVLGLLEHGNSPVCCVDRPNSLPSSRPDWLEVPALGQVRHSVLVFEQLPEAAGRIEPTLGLSPNVPALGRRLGFFLVRSAVHPRRPGGRRMMETRLL